MSYIYIDQPGDHKSLLEEVSDAQYVGIDTEFMRERHYYPTLALLQLALPSGIYLVDPVDNPLADEIINMLTIEGTASVMHSAGQDIEVLNCHSDKPLASLFDTQIAAAMLGLGDQISYAALVRELINVELPKSQTRTNWLKRPLSQAQLDYAADDVLYLAKSRDWLSEQLENRGRSEWLTEECTNMVTKLSSPATSESLLKRVKGQQDLNRDQLAILLELALWREEKAKSRNLPRGWVISDHGLVAIAATQSADSSTHKHNDEVPDRFLERNQQKLEAVIERGLAMPDDEKPAVISFRGLTNPQKSMLKKMRARLQTLSKEQQISMQLLSNRSDMEKLICGNRQIPLLQGWRYGLAGKEIESLLDH